jgi:hypothetical protein
MPLPTFRAAITAAFSHVQNASPEYISLLNQQDDGIEQMGFAYLNSADFLRFNSRLVEIEDETINRSENPGFVAALATWRQIMYRREQAMIDNLYRYAREAFFERGVFLVGAAHCSGIIQGIRDSSHVETDLIEWALGFQ